MTANQSCSQLWISTCELVHCVKVSEGYLLICKYSPGHIGYKYLENIFTLMMLDYHSISSCLFFTYSTVNIVTPYWPKLFLIKLLANLWAIDPIFQNTVLETIEFSLFSQFPLLPEVFLGNLLSTYPPFIPLFIPTIPHEIEPKLPTENLHLNWLIPISWSWIV